MLQLPPRYWSATGSCRSRSSKGPARLRRRISTADCAARRTTSSMATYSPSTSCSTIPRARAGLAGAWGSTHPELLVPDPRRSIAGGCFVREAFKYNPDTWDGRVMYSLARALKVSLDTPWEKLPDRARAAILNGIDPKKVVLAAPPEAKVQREDWTGK